MILSPGILLWYAFVLHQTLTKLINVGKIYFCLWSQSAASYPYVLKESKRERERERERQTDREIEEGE